MAKAETSQPVPSLHPSDSEDNTYRILLVGKTGSGKSRTGNTLLGDRRFKTKLGMSSETYECQLEQVRNASYTMEVMDCPGLFDTKMSNRDIMNQILKAVGSMHPGPNAVLYTIKIGDRYTEEEYQTFQLLKKTFGREVVNYMIIGFTHGDKLAMEEMTIDEYVSDAIKEEKKFNEVFEQCGKRYVEFNNTPSGPKGQQVEILLTKINDMVQPYKYRTFRCDKFEIVAIEIEAELRRRLLAKKEQSLHKKGQDENVPMVKIERERVQGKSKERGASEMQKSAGTVPLPGATNTEAEGPSLSHKTQPQTAAAETSVLDSLETERDPLLDFDEETIKRERFQLRQEIAQGVGFFKVLHSVLDTELTSIYTVAIGGCALAGTIAGPIGTAVGALVGLAICGVYLTVEYIETRRKLLREHMKQIQEDREKKLRAKDTGSNT